ncbi:MAG: SRPBCC family protein [Chloroflexi bacterium]|nr:SRPBCC family protein [Chloroflexota bacterium]
MAHLDIRRFIAAPPQAVWDVLANLEGQAAWMVDVRRLDVVTAEKRGSGAVLHVTSELFGLPLVKDVMAITAWEPPRRMDVEHRGQFHGSGQFLLDPVQNGTIFTWIEDFRPPLGRLGEAAFGLVVRPHLMRVFARSMANVARLAEASAGGPPPDPAAATD